MDAMLEMACDPTASRVLDVVLEGQTVPQRAKQKLVLGFLGHYHVLVDDRLGSRVADRCWAASDPYLKVCSSIDHASVLLKQGYSGTNRPVSHAS